MDFEAQNILLLCLGGVVAVLSTWIGVGGGLIIVPTLPLLLGTTALEAVGTSLATIFLVACSNVFSFARKQVIDWPKGLALGLTAVPTGLLSAKAITGVSDLTIKAIFGATLLLLIPISRGPGIKADRENQPKEKHWIKWTGVGMLCGVVSGTTGLGAGLVAIPLLDRLRMVDIRRLVPTVSLMILLNTMAGLTGLALGRPEFHGWRIGPIWADAALWIFVGAQVVSPFTIRQQHRFPPELRRKVIMTFLVLLSLKTWYEVYRLWN